MLRHVILVQVPGSPHKAVLVEHVIRDVLLSALMSK